MVISAPTSCPECSSAIVVFTDPDSKITTHWCKNIECTGRVRDMLTHIADRTMLEIDGLGEEMARFLADNKYVVDISDLFLFAADCKAAMERKGEEVFIAGMNKKGIGGAMTVKMVHSIMKARNAPWDRWLAAMNIPMIGRRQSILIAKVLKLGQEDMGKLPEILESANFEEIEGIGEQKKAAIIQVATSEAFKGICHRLYHNSLVRPTPLVAPEIKAGAPLAGITFVITGELNDIGSREYITAELEKLGAVSKSGVSKKVSHLIVGDEPGSAKLAKAKTLNIPHLDEAWVRNVFTQHNIGMTKIGDKFNLDWADGEL